MPAKEGANAHNHEGETDASDDTESAEKEAPSREQDNTNYEQDQGNTAKFESGAKDTNPYAPPHESNFVEHDDPKENRHCPLSRCQCGDGYARKQRESCPGKELLASRLRWVRRTRFVVGHGRKWAFR